MCYCSTSRSSHSDLHPGKKRPNWRVRQHQNLTYIHVNKAYFSASVASNGSITSRNSHARHFTLPAVVRRVTGIAERVQTRLLASRQVRTEPVTISLMLALIHTAKREPLHDKRRLLLPITFAMTQCLSMTRKAVARYCRGCRRCLTSNLSLQATKLSYDRARSYSNCL